MSESVEREEEEGVDKPESPTVKNDWAEDEPSDFSNEPGPSHTQERKRSCCVVTEQASRCSVCGEVLIDPVSTSCGHWFCRQCITSYRDQSAPTGHNGCPQCGKRSRITPGLKTPSQTTPGLKTHRKTTPGLKTPSQTTRGQTSEKHFVDQHRRFLIDKVTTVDPILDLLLEVDIITNEGYSNVRSKSTTQEMMRELYKLYKLLSQRQGLKEHEKPLLEDL